MEIKLKIKTKQKHKMSDYWLKQKVFSYNLWVLYSTFLMVLIHVFKIIFFQKFTVVDD